MKIAIQGHATRFKEVIDTLVNLGGINKRNFVGDDTYICYYIDKFNYIEGQFGTKIDKDIYQLYTLEEFEKMYPFKIGEKVVYNYAPDFIGTVVDIKFDDNIPYRVNIKDTICTCGKNTLKLYQMTNPRNITLTLDKAREWYQKGGELKEVALQAFSEKELHPLPKSWEEYCKEHYVVKTDCVFGPYTPIKYIALWRLERLRNCYRQGWKPKPKEAVYAIKYSVDGLNVYNFCSQEFLSFQSREIAEEFLKNFEHLIKEAGDLI